MKLRSWYAAVCVGLALVVGACGRSPLAHNGSRAKEQPATIETPRAAPSDDFFVELSRVEPSRLTGDILYACDSVGAMLDSTVGTGSREDGSFDDSFRGERRLGCRMTRVSTAADTSSRQSGDPLLKALNRRGYAQDLRYAADGPDASDYGLRRRDILCLFSERHSGSDDDDTTSSAKGAPDETGLLVECARDVSSNDNSGVPDSVWRIASGLGMDSTYAIDFRLQYPPFLSGDFDGDGIPDAAVPVTDRKSGKLGIAFLFGGTRTAMVAATGTPPTNGSGDLSWIDDWGVAGRGAMPSPTIPDRPPAAARSGFGGRGDVLWVARRDSASGFLWWADGGLRWEASVQAGRR